MILKRFLSAIAAAAILCTATAGCGSKDDKDSSKETSSGSGAETSDNGGTGDEGGTSDASQTHLNDPMTVTSATDLVAQMTTGWNLGNTLDATGGNGVDSETSWLPNKVKTDEIMIKMVKEAGFNTIRIPVSWGNHMDENYQVDPAWMDRVQEVVNYGYDNGMFVILNTHHEEWYMPKKSSVDHDLEELAALWTQIAERFKGYDEHLIFEGVNEPRLRGEGAEWTGTSEARDIVNLYAKTFVETVRATGGNNADRCLMVTPYAASSSSMNMQALEIPEKSDKIIVSIHAYLPYSFALDTKGTDVYDPNDSSIPDLFYNIDNNFLSQGIPVIIGEYGSVNKDNIDDRVQCMTDYLTLAKQYGVPCIWWDNYARIGNGENFGLLNRAEYDWYFPELIAVVQKIYG
ncbi:MAG: glycoside hydrolase family 5 protein [Ruminococcus sp.]|nr:glycoside hydrolase family 5 protein [Ruminococcus sp.]